MVSEAFLHFCIVAYGEKMYGPHFLQYHGQLSTVRHSSSFISPTSWKVQWLLGNLVCQLLHRQAAGLFTPL